jgi:6-phosphogluconolactonase (cycloisomerase 2 family)
VRSRLAPIAALVIATLALPGGAARAATLYAPTYGTSPEAIRGFAIAADGSPSPLAGTFFTFPSSDPGGVNSLAFTPDGGRAVSTFLFTGGLRGLTVAPDGSIAATAPAVDAPSITGLAVSPDGRFAYAPTRTFSAEPPAVGILGYSIGVDGTLTPIDGSPFSTGEFGDVAITPDGRFLYGRTGAQLKHFEIASDGKLTEVGMPAAFLATTLQVSPDGRFLFASETSGMDAVTSFSIAPDGNLTANGSPALTGGPSLGFFAVAPDGRHIYMPDSSNDVIVTAAVADDGQLSVIGSVPVDQVETVGMSPDGRFLYYGTTGGSGVIGVASIGSDAKPTILPATTPWPSGEPERLTFRPSVAPTAAFGAVAGAPGAVSNFDAGASAGAARFDWDFGDGTALPDGGPTPTHSYASAGVYEVRLTVSDANGCSTRSVYTGQSTVCPGGPSATTTATVDTLPALTALSVTNARFAVAAARRRRVKRGTAFRYRLSEPARVTITIRRKTIGRRVGGKCRAPTRRNRKRKLCIFFKRVGRIAADAKAGRNRTKFSGKLRGRRLRRGRFRAVAVAKDSAGGRSRPRAVAFRIVRAR